MTRVFDERARAVHFASPMLFGTSVSSSARAADLDVRQVPASTARPYIASGHYSGTFPDSTRETFAGFYAETFAAAVTFGMGANHAAFAAVVPDIELGEYRELTRLWVDDACPRNTASRLVSSALASLPSEVRMVLSFADTAQGHVGYVYQALNFLYLGRTKPGKTLLDELGKPVHPRLLGIYRMRRPELAEMSGPQIANQLGWSFAEGSVKHRYVLPTGGPAQRRRLRKQLEGRAEPYPKGDTARIREVS
jgi:hypothetical protein